MTEVKKSWGWEGIKVSLVFHVFVYLFVLLAWAGGETVKIAAYSLVPYWTLVALIFWKRKAPPTRLEYALIAYGYPVLFLGFFLWSAYAQ